MIQPIRSLNFLFLVLCLITWGKSTDTQGTGIVYTSDKHICLNVTWKLEKRDVYVNVSTVLKTGDGKAITNVISSGLVNVTTTTEICCPGFYTKKKGRCKNYSKTPRPQLTRKRSAPSTATETDHGIKYNITTVHPCDICEQFGSCSNEPGCVLSAGHGSGSSHKTDNWTIISIVLSISVIGNVIAFVLGFIRYQRRRQRNLSQTAPVIKLTNDVNNGGENIMAESSHEYLQMTDDCHSYNALNNNRAYVSMYNELNVTHEYTDAFTPNGN
ncbi:unnamed protein product [Mytilus edulis]|uniref:Uncharacterized protein n=1 Tax=Mytilus edulis TaxID=6550 RepID=A0A8S3VKY1_MYTED|nr:unnamed protein product [Mytilus edulis]